MKVSDRGRLAQACRRLAPPDPDLVSSLVTLDEDAFFVLTLGELYGVICTRHEHRLADHDGRRPYKPDSMHCAAYREELIPWQDNWDLVRNRLAP